MLEKMKIVERSLSYSGFPPVESGMKVHVK